MRVVDLTHTLTDGMPVYPGDPEVGFARVSATPESDYNVAQICLGTHSGTHIDAPYHRGAAGATVDRIVLEECVGPAEVLDLRDKGPGSEIGISDLERFASRITAGGRLLLRTDWSKRFGDRSFFAEQPDLTPDAARWLVARRVRLLGIEQPSVHRERHQEVHSILLEAGIVILEALANLAGLRKERVWLVVLPLKLDGLDGSPARAIAIEGMQGTESD